MSDTPLSDLAADLLRLYLVGSLPGVRGEAVPGVSADQLRRAYAELVGTGLLRPRLSQIAGHLPAISYALTDQGRKLHRVA